MQLSLYLYRYFDALVSWFRIQTYLDHLAFAISWKNLVYLVCEWHVVDIEQILSTFSHKFLIENFTNESDFGQIRTLPDGCHKIMNENVFFFPLYKL